VLVDLKPSGQHYMPQFHQAGGVPRLLKEIADDLSLHAKTAFGTTIGDSIAGAEDVPNQTVIRPRSAPLSSTGAIAILGGNLAPRGAVIKQSAATKRLQQHEGRTIVFESVDDLMLRIDDPDLDVEADDILVLRNAGPKGAPGMPEAGYLPIPRKLAEQGVTDMVRISDARMSGTAFGTIVLHISPEAADGGPLAIVRNGERIRLDVEARTIDLCIPEEEIASRLAALRSKQASSPSTDRGYLRLHMEHVSQADLGADLDFLTVPAETPRS
jgi:dihydroxy-acid dehydratase